MRELFELAGTLAMSVDRMSWPLVVALTADDGDFSAFRALSRALRLLLSILVGVRPNGMGTREAAGACSLVLAGTDGVDGAAGAVANELLLARLELL